MVAEHEQAAERDYTEKCSAGIQRRSEESGTDDDTRPLAVETAPIRDRGRVYRHEFVTLLCYTFRVQRDKTMLSINYFGSGKAAIRRALPAWGAFYSGG